MDVVGGRLAQSEWLCSVCTAGMNVVVVAMRVAQWMLCDHRTAVLSLYRWHACCCGGHEGTFMDVVGGRLALIE
eukprot:1157474-Pelagomonas_calceolata.AAC.1